jgi:formylglycine-generating enzyme required for sulfatase activity
LSGLLVALGFARPGGTDAAKDKKRPKSFTNSIGMKFVLVKAGKFLMGSTKKEQDDAIADVEKIAGRRIKKDVYRAEGPRHEVEITKDFYLGVYEVTQGQWKAIMGKDNNPSYFSKTGAGKDRVKGFSEKDLDDFPVESVSWKDTQAFLKKLNALAAEKKVKVAYRLPTEAEWEYACRGGSRSSSKPFHFKFPSDSLGAGQANFHARYPYGDGKKGKALYRTNTVGKNGEPNPLGLYDMHGNVWEWCSDWADDYYYGKSPERDPSGPADGSHRVVRGGGWYSTGQYCRAARRNGHTPSDRSFNLGFRVTAVPGE